MACARDSRPSLDHPATSHTPPDRPSLARRLGWFVALYAGGVAAVSLVAAVVRFWIG